MWQAWSASLNKRRLSRRLYGQYYALCFGKPKQNLSTKCQVPVSALQQLEHLLWQLVSLCDHRRACLLQNLCPAQIGGFCSKVGIHDAATRCGEVFCADTKVLNCAFKAALNSTQSGPCSIDCSQCRIHGQNCVICFGWITNTQISKSSLGNTSCVSCSSRSCTRYTLGKSSEVIKFGRG